MKKIAASGFTLAEMLITLTILGIVAVVAIPLLSSNDPQKLNVAASGTASLLRFALSEASRTGGYALVDGKTTANHLVLYRSDSSGNLVSSIADPLTKRPMDLDVNGNAFSSGVALTPQFRAGGQANTQLLIGPGLTQMQGFNGAGANQGLLQANSGVVLSYGSQSVSVSIDEKTGRVSLP